MGSILGDESIRLVVTKNCYALKCCQFFPQGKIKPLRQEMLLAGFRMQLVK